MTPEQHQQVRRFARDIGVVQSQQDLNSQVVQGYEILNACGLYDAADLLRNKVDRHRVDL